VSERWEVHLSADAAAVLRAAPRAVAAAVGRTLDELERAGRAGVELLDDGAEWVGRVVAPDHLLLIAGRAEDRRLLVVRVDLPREQHAYPALDVLPLRVSTRRALGELLHGVGLDVRYTLRGLRRTPLFAAIVVATLAIGFGGATALLDIVDTVYRSALPFGEGDRLVRVRNAHVSASGEIRRYNLTPSDFDLLRRGSRSFDGIIAQGGRSLSLIGDGPAERVSAIGVSPGWAQTLRLRPVLGRTFNAAEEAAGTDAGVGLISHALWQSRFGGEPTALGRLLRYDGGAITVIGVMPPHLNYPYDAAVWTPWTFAPTNTTTSSLNVVARLAAGETMESARADLERVHAERVAAGLNRVATQFDLATVRADFIRDEGRTVQALSATVLFLLTLACVNVASLLVARFTIRRAEFGLRAALGGGRLQQTRQLLLETLLLFAAGAAGGLGLAWWLRRALAITVPDTLRTELGFVATGVGFGVAAAVMAASLLCGVLVGIAAARRALRSGFMPVLRQGGQWTLGRGDRRTFDVLVAAQLGLSLVLLVGASLLIGRFRELVTAHPGYELDDVVTMRVTVEQERYQNAEARQRLALALEERLAAVPGVEAVGITTVNPLCCGDWGAPIEIEGRVAGPDEPPLLVAHSYVSPGYFGAMTIPILRGEGFRSTDRPGAPLTVVVDEPLARMAWPGEDPLGKRLRLGRPGQEWRTVIGVVPVTTHEAEMRASWFLPYYQDPMGASGEHLHMMVRRGPGVTLEALRAVVGGVDSALAVYGATTMEALRRERTLQDRLGAVVAGVFAAFGLILAGCSLYGLLSYSVELRSAEMGVRMALGANRGAIVSLVLRQAAARLAAGTLVGIPLALAANQLLRGSIDGLGWVPWQVLLGLAVVLAGVAAAAAAVPALRATRVEPLRALR
jgi:predicted permease